MGEKLSFVEHYRVLRQTNPAREFIEHIAEITKKSPKTVKQWLTGKQRPDPLTMSVIGKDLDIPVDVLFPSPNTN